MKRMIIVLLFSTAFGLTEAASQNASVALDERNRDQVLKLLVPVLRMSKAPCRLAFSGVCANDTFPFPVFPRVNVMPPKGKETLASVREIFKEDKNTSVTRSPSGMIRITLGQPPLALLETRLRSIRFTTEQAYNGWRAVGAVLNANEVGLAMKQRHLEKGIKMDVGPLAVQEQGRKLPHLPAVIKNQTMDQVLDLIAKTFGGIVIYETCAAPDGKRLVYLDFIQVAEP